MLSPQQIQELREEFGINPSGSPSQSAEIRMNTASISPSNRLEMLKSGEYGSEDTFTEEPSYSSPEEQKSFLGKTGGYLEGGLRFGESLLSPTIKAFQTGIYQPIREVQKVVPGGMTGKEEIPTPFGTIKDVEEMGLGERLSTGAEIALTFLPVEKLASPFFKILGGTTKRIGGAISGKGVDVLNKIINNPRAAQIGLRSDEVKLLKNLANEASDEVIRLSRQTKSQYAKALENLPDKKISLNNVITKLSNNLSEFGVKVSDKSKNLNFTESPFRQSDEKVLSEVFDVINNWKDKTPQGLNNLAVKVGNFVKAGEQSDMLNSVISKTKSSIRNVVSDVIPEAKTMVSDYSKQMDFIDDLRDILSVKTNLKTPAGIRKTATKIQGLFNANKQLAVSVVEEMKGGSDIIAKEAGRQLSQAPSRAANTIGDTAKSLIQSAIPPRAIGEIATYTGIAKNKVKEVTDVIQKLAPVERTAIFNYFSNLFGGNQENQ